jgi:uncharacterized C2H2 Zn-finger protein
MIHKYKCEQCNLIFETIKQYIDHLELHNNALVDIPKPQQKKEGFFSKLFKRKQKTEEVVNMVDKKETDSLQKIDAIEKSIVELTKLVAHHISQSKVDAVVDVAKVVPVAVPSASKVMKITLLVQEQGMFEIIKEIQDNANYELNDIGLHLNKD